MGPPPPEVQQRFVVLKYCTYVLLGSFLARIIYGLFWSAPGEGFNEVISSINLLLVGTFGVFLLRDDEQVGRIYTWLANGCCQMCAERFGGGMSCLMPFVLVNLVTLIMDIVLSGELGQIYTGFKILATENAPPLVSLQLAVRTLALASSLIAEGVGAWTGWKAYNQAVELTSGPSSGGDWAASGARGGGGFPRASETREAREARPAANFEPFAGSGQRLGGGG